MLMLYVIGVCLAIVAARLFRRFLFKGEDVPFVMELPPYRMPTGKSILIHMWEKAKQYLHKMGGIILVASILIWFLGYFPRETANTPHFQEQITALQQQTDSPEKEIALAQLLQQQRIDHQQNSYIGQVGQAIEPILRPLGFNWKIGVSLMSGMAAKEIVVSTLSVLYTGSEEDDGQALGDRLREDKDTQGNPLFTPLVALSLMIFVLIYFPCIATVTAIVNESGSWRWGFFVILYTCVLAWIASFIVYQTGHFFIGVLS